MRTTSQVWKNIVAKGEFNMESVARIYGATGSDPNGTAGSDSRGSYKEYATITAPIITRALLSGDSISLGNTISGQLNFTVMTTDTIPKSAMIVIRARVKDGTNTSEWLEFGTYWIDHRVKNDDLTDIEAYDAMKKGNQAYADNSQTLNWPKKVWVVVQRIAEQMGVAIDSRTTASISSGVGNISAVYKPTDEMTLLDILRYLGEILGGNWTITDDNELRLVRPISPAEETYYIIDHSNNAIKTDQNDYLIHQGNSKQHEDQTPPTGIGMCYVPVVLGSLTTANKYVITKLTIARDSDTVYIKGDDTGFNLVIQENNPYVNNTWAQLAYNFIKDVEYAPFEATNAIYDPAVELGDWIIAGSVYSVLYNDKRTLDVGYSADISAPGRDEMEDEYPYQTFQQKTQYISEQVSNTRTLIEQTQTDVRIIAEDYTKASEIRSVFALDKTNITLSAGTDSQGQATGKITFNSGTLIVNAGNFQLDETGHLECYGADINGDLFCGTDDGMWAKLQSGLMTGGSGSSQYGSIHFAATSYDTDIQRDRHGIQITGDVLRISTNKIAVANSSSESTNATYGVTNNWVPIVTNVSYDQSTGRIISVTTSALSFINGICTAVP